MRNIYRLIFAFMFFTISLPAAAQSSPDGSTSDNRTSCEKVHDRQLTELLRQHASLGEKEYGIRLAQLIEERKQCLVNYCVPPPPLPVRPVSPVVADSGCTDKCGESYGQLRQKIADLQKAYRNLKMVPPAEFDRLQREFIALKEKVEKSSTSSITSSANFETTGLTAGDYAKLTGIKNGLDQLLAELDGIRTRLAALEQSGTNGSGPKGDKGEQGEVGPIGPVGPEGPMGPPGRDAVATSSSSTSDSGRELLMGFGLGVNLDFRGLKFEGTSYVASFVLGGTVLDGQVPLRVFGRVGFGVSDKGLLNLELGPEFLISFEEVAPKMAWLEVGVEGKFSLDVRPDFKSDRCPTATAWAIGGGPIIKASMGKGFSVQASADFLYLSWARCGETPGQIPRKDSMAEMVITIRPINFKW